MTRDYKTQNRNKGGNKDHGASPWKFMFAGFGLGLIAAFVLFLKLNPSAEQAQTPTPNVTSTPLSTADTEFEGNAVEQQSAATKARKNLPSLPPQGQAELDFYEMLPEFEVVVSDDDNSSTTSSGNNGNTTTQAASSNTSKSKVQAVPGTYILQAGSFKSFTDADRRKAQLAFKGIESNIQQVVLNKDQTWYRVYVGPTKNLKSLENSRSLLRRDNIDVLMLKVKP